MSDADPVEYIESDSGGEFVSRKVSPTPKSDLDFNMMTTDTVWGQDFIPKELKDRLSKYYSHVDNDGSVKVTKEGYWQIFGYFTRDLRLGNLSDGSNPFGSNELAVVRYHLDLASDYLSYSDPEMLNGFIEAFMVHMSRVAGILETSHSKKGWFRKKAGTFTQEQYYTPIKNPQDTPKNIFGRPKNTEDQE